MARMTKIGKLYKNPREELFLRDDFRLSISYYDVLIEGFYSSQNHPYAIFNMKGKLLETNQEDKNMFTNLFLKYFYKVQYHINNFGVEV